MTIQIDKPELEALIEERLKTGSFRNVEDLLLHALGADKPIDAATAIHGAKRRLEKDDGVWVLHTGQPLSATIVEDTIHAVRQERDFANLGTLR